MTRQENEQPWAPSKKTPKRNATEQKYGQQCSFVRRCSNARESRSVAFLFRISTAYISLARNKTISLVLSAWKKLKLEFSQTSVLWLIKPRSRSQELPREPKLDCFSNTLIVTLNQFERLGGFCFEDALSAIFFFRRITSTEELGDYIL